MIDQLKSIGIEKAKPFVTDANTKAILEDAIGEARAWLDAKYETAFSPPDFPARYWAVPASPEVIEGMSTHFAKPDLYPVDGRGLTFSFAYFSAKHLGAGQFYLMTIKDRDGHSFDGGSTYRLSVPPNPPVGLYWSATAYDRATHALIRNISWSSRASTTQDLHKNGDGSVDIWFGPEAPAARESNWVPTTPEGKFEVLFRLYGPEKPFFDKTWVLPDIERIAGGVHAQTPASTPIPVTVDNFIRAESDMYFALSAKDARGVGKLIHRRVVVQVDKQPVVRANRDTLYSSGVF